jgi:TetR/AcrR family transcriptional repressor of nem operon
VATAPSQEAEPSQRLTRKGQATRRRIVTKAAALMYERGVAGTSTEDVQLAAGVSSSQIYHYFADKKTLVRAVIAHQTETVLDFHEPLLSRLDSIEALEAWRDLVVDLCREPDRRRGCPIGSLSSELSGQDPDAHADLAAGFERWEYAIRDGLAAMRERGELRADIDPERLALAMLAAIQGGLLLGEARGDSAALEAVLEAMIDHIRGHRPAGG